MNIEPKALKAVFAIWIILWILFLVREDKDGQYGSLLYMYSSEYPDKVRFLTGDENYGLISFCRENIPEGSSYSISGFEKFSIDEMRFRYYLWPLRNEVENPEYMILLGDSSTAVPGYKDHKICGKTGRILVKEGDR